MKQEYELVEDLDDELEELGRLTTAGNFRAAKEFFTHHLRRHIENPLVFILYAEILLEIGDYQSIIQLEGIAHTVFPRPWRPLRLPLEDNDKTACSPYNKLYLNWKLIHLIACDHNKQDIRSHDDPEEPWLFVLNPETFDSTQVRIFVLLSKLWKIRGLWLEEDPMIFSYWRARYSLLVEEQRAWDFRDIFLGLVNLSGVELLLSPNFFFDSETPEDFYKRIKEDWLTESPEVSVYLAFLDLSSSMVMALISYERAGKLARAALEFADEIGEKVMEFWPEQTGTRPYLIWLVAKAATAAFQKSGTSDGTYEGAPCSRSEPGLVILPISNTMIPALPFYIPIKAENPRKGLRTTRYKRHALCELAIRSEKPITSMDELAEVQRAQGDLYGRLETCLAKYLVCQSEESKQALRHELAGFGHWEDVSSLSNFQAMLVATRDVQLRALSLTDMKAFESSISAALPYYAHLPLGLQQDIDDDLVARSRQEQHMRTIARVQPHKDTDKMKITQGSRERRANKTLDQDTFRGSVREQEILASKRTQMRWDRERMMREKEERRHLIRQLEREEERRQEDLSRSSARRTTITRPQSHEQRHDEIRIVDVPFEYTSTGTPIPVEDPEQSVKRRPDTFATVQSASSSSVPSPYDGPEVTESMESPSSDSAKKKPSGEGGLSLREDPKVTDLVGPERVLERVFPSATSRPKRATSVDLGVFSRRSEKGASELEETFEKTW